MTRTKNSEHRGWPTDPKERLVAAGLAWDLVLQIAGLRHSEELTQEDLAEQLNTKQPNVSRLESPAYDRQNLQTLRAVGEVLDAYVDVIYVPKSKYAEYMANRYLPALGEQPPAHSQPTPGMITFGGATIVPQPSQPTNIVIGPPTYIGASLAT